MSDKSRVFIGTATDVGQLRQAVEHSVNRLVSQLNADKVSKNLDVRNNRVINVAWPSDLHDAVNVEYIQSLFGKIAFKKKYEYDKCTFGLAIDTDLVVQNDTNPHYIVEARQLHLSEVAAKIKVAAVSTDTITAVEFRLHRNWIGTNGTASSEVIHTKVGTSTWIDFPYPSGVTTVQFWNVFDVTQFSYHDWLTIDILKIGSTTPGQTLVAVMKFKIVSPAPL